MGDMQGSMHDNKIDPDQIADQSSAEADEEGAWIPPGDYVAVTVRGGGTWKDDAWRSGQGPTTGLLASVGPAADTAGAVYAYVRNLGSDGSVTTLFPRLVPPS